MSPSHAVKRGKRYRYYTSQAVVQLRPETGGSITRLPADDIERVVIQDLLHALTDRITAHTLLDPDAPIAQRLALTEHATALADTLSDDRATLRALIQKVTAGQNGVRVDIATAALANVLGVDLPGADAPHDSLNASIRRSTAALPRRSEAHHRPWPRNGHVATAHVLAIVKMTFLVEMIVDRGVGGRSGPPTVPCAPSRDSASARRNASRRRHEAAPRPGNDPSPGRGTGAALLRSRSAALCRQPRFASHHQAPHTGRLSAIA